MDVYSHHDYRELIRDWLKNEAARGGQRLLAEAAGCLPSYLSQVLNATAELTPDQAYCMTSVMGVDHQASEFFLLLVQRSRAASRTYRDHLTHRIDEIRHRKQQLSERLSPARLLSGDEQARYYAVWFYPAIHTLASVPEFQTVKALEKKLRLSPTVVDLAIADLEHMELVRRDGQTVVSLAGSVHAASTSALNFSYHAVWRAMANQRMQEAAIGDGIHYTSLCSLSKADAKQLKSMLLDFIQKSREVIGPSPEQTSLVLLCDLFEL